MDDLDTSPSSWGIDQFEPNDTDLGMLYELHSMGTGNSDGTQLFHDNQDTGSIQYQTMEEQLLTLNSPKPEIEELLFPDLENSHSSDTGSPRSGEIPTSDELQLTLYHKPRGCKGLWTAVEANSALRVTKGKGKWLRLELKCRSPITNSNTEFFLVDISEGPPTYLEHTPDDGVSIELTNESEVDGLHAIDVELKLDRVCKRLQFWASVNMTGYGFLYASTIAFEAHNNGKAKRKKKVEDAASPGGFAHSDAFSSSSGISPPTPIVSQPPPLPTHYETPKKKRKTPAPPEVAFPFDETPDEDIPASSVIPGSLKVQGVVRAKAFLQFSDMRLKTDVRDINDAVNTVLKLQGKTFYWKDGEEKEGGDKVIGLIAQEVQKVVPEVVRLDQETGYLSVAYAELVPILIEALKQHIVDNDANKSQVASELEALQEKLLKLEKRIDGEDSSAGGALVPKRSVQTKLGKSLVRSSTLFLFFAGLAVAIFGAILLGSSLTGPSQSIIVNGEKLALTSLPVVEASDLKPMDEDGMPDPYCELALGPNICRTPVVYNTMNPRFQTTCIETFDATIVSLNIQLYDSNLYSADKRMGKVTIDLHSLEYDKLYDQHYELTPNIDGDTVTGSVRIRIEISSPKEWAPNVGILVAGIVVLSVGAFLGFYCWQYQKSK